MSNNDYFGVEVNTKQSYETATEFPTGYYPIHGNQVDTEPKVNVTAFGDGYELRSVDGINNQKQVWSLTFEDTPERITEIAKFLSVKGAHKAFYWITPDHSRMSEGTAGNLEASYWEYDVTPAAYKKGDDLKFKYLQASGNFRYFQALNINGYPTFSVPVAEYNTANSKLASGLQFNTTNTYTADITNIDYLRGGQFMHVIGYNLDLKITKVNTTTIQSNFPTLTARNLPTIISNDKQADAHNIETHRIKVVCRKWSRTRNPGWQQLTCTFEQVFEY